MYDDSSSEEVDETQILPHPVAVEKSKLAATVANDVMRHLIGLVKPGACILDLCEVQRTLFFSMKPPNAQIQAGDVAIAQGVAKHYSKKKDMKKGVAFPTCISVNNVVGHFCPMEDDKSVITEGDVVKIDFGVHIDGHISCMAHTVVASSTPTEAIEGKAADVICAAYFAGEAALHLMRPGGTNQEVTNVINHVAREFGVNVVEVSFVFG
jgi:methionine aminopeptidase